MFVFITNSFVYCATQNYKKSDKKQAKISLPKGFYEKYEDSLKKLRINTTKAQKYIDIHFYDNKDLNSKFYHKKILEEYEEKKFHIKVPNKNNRIYHILTRTPRELKYFLNIKYIVDIHYSHPVLFTSLIYEKYEIPQNYRYTLSRVIKDIEILENRNIRRRSNSNSNSNSNRNSNSNSNSSSNIGNYYSRKHIHNILINKGLDHKKIKKLPLDVLRYIHLTSSGIFWDKVLEKDNGKIGQMNYHS